MKNKTSSTHKKVVIRKLDETVLKGYVDGETCPNGGVVEVLDREGHVWSIPLTDLKGVFFVRDFDGDPRRPERKVFYSRPKRSGLWIRLTFKDSEIMEGLLPNSLLDLPAEGFFLTPPDVYSNNLKVFVPRSALSALQVIGVISEAGARPRFRAAGGAGEKVKQTSAQMGLFSSVARAEP